MNFCVFCVFCVLISLLRQPHVRQELPGEIGEKKVFKINNK